MVLKVSKQPSLLSLSKNTLCKQLEDNINQNQTVYKFLMFINSGMKIAIV